jgi:hypothetical protein
MGGQLMRRFTVIVALTTIALTASVVRPSVANSSAAAPTTAAPAVAASPGIGTFSTPTWVDYKRQGGEPTTVVDRYRFPDGSYKDLTYVTAPEGFVYPHFSYFWKSSDLGQSFRVTKHVPGQGQSVAGGGGGGDSHIAVGQVSHAVFFADLPADCETMNRSTDLGETFVGDDAACGVNPGAIDDRPWTAADEMGLGASDACLTAAFPTCGKVYLSFINFTSQVAPYLVLARSTHDGFTGTFLTDSVCNPVNGNVPAADSTPTACPDPVDSRLQLAGPVVVDTTPSSPYYHSLYIPFVRGGSPVTGTTFPSPPWDLYVAISRDFGLTWTRHLVSQRASHNPVNIFVQLTIDTAGNLYYDWAETRDTSVSSTNLGGQTEIKYLVSTTGGTSSSGTFGGCPAANSTTDTCVSNAWRGPYTISSGGSAVMPWFQAGDRGRVDAVWYQSNSTANPNTPTAGPNPPVWNVIFAQSLNALTGGGWSTQILSTHPNHYGQVCTNGLLCATGGNRNLLDFLTVDVDHRGAAETTWSDDNNSRQDTFQFFSRQLNGPSIFVGQTINLAQSWPVSGNTAFDRRADVYTAAGVYNDACTGMDLLGMQVFHNGTTVTVTLSVNGPPTAAHASACSATPGYTTGLWGAVFWAPVRSAPDCTSGECFTGDAFYLARRDPPAAATTERPAFPNGEAGRVLDRNQFNTSNELRPEFAATSSVSCGDSTCTVTVSADFGSNDNPQKIAACANLDSVTGASLYYEGSTQRDPATRIQNGNSEQADVTPALNLRGCTPPPPPPGTCREADANGQFDGTGGHGDVDADNDSCEDHDADHVTMQDRGDGKDLRSTQVISTQFDDVAHTMTIFGSGTSGGQPATFLLVLTDSSAASRGSVSLSVSDGFVTVGNLVSGAVLLH